MHEELFSDCLELCIIMLKSFVEKAQQHTVLQFTSCHMCLIHYGEGFKPNKMVAFVYQRGFLSRENVVAKTGFTHSTILPRVCCGFK